MFKKIFKYFTTDDILKGLSIAILLSSFIYLSFIKIEIRLVNSVLGLLGLYLLIGNNNRVWFWSGLFTSFFWFWWILLGFRYYGLGWAIPIGTLLVVLVYGSLFWFFSYVSNKFSTTTNIPLPFFHGFWLLIFSYIHPFGFDWFKPELIFVDSYIGVTKWQFAIVMTAISLSRSTKIIKFLPITVFAFALPLNDTNIPDINNIKLVTTNETVDEKWVETNQEKINKMIFNEIDKAINEKKSIVVLPESVFPIFLNLEPELINELRKKAEKIDVVIGGLYLDEGIPRNSTYVFANDKITVVNKVILVPFGETNPLPDFIGKYINKIFFKDGVVDYVGSNEIIDYELDHKKIRNAICYEATSETLYKDNPRYMIAISNNGWFKPSIEPTLQQLLLKYYSKKYGTAIYHSINMSMSYVIKNGEVFWAK